MSIIPPQPGRRPVTSILFLQKYYNPPPGLRVNPAIPPIVSVLYAIPTRYDVIPSPMMSRPSKNNHNHP